MIEDVFYSFFTMSDPFSFCRGTRNAPSGKIFEEFTNYRLLLSVEKATNMTYSFDIVQHIYQHKWVGCEAFLPNCDTLF